jgi:drug/metabolite transporter (DMT)-like permease
MNLIIGQLFALFTAACFAQNSIVYSFAGRRVGSTAVTHVRLWVALPAIMVVHLFFNGTLLPLHLSQAGYLYLGASGFIGFFMADLFIFAAFVDLGPRETLVIMTLAPIFGAVISWLSFGETLTLMQIIGILVTVGGVAWVVFEERSNPDKRSRKQALGVLFAFLGALTQATGMVLAKGGVASGVHPVSANAVRITAGLAGLIVFALLRGRFLEDFRRMRDLKALAYTSSGALVGPVLGVLFSLYALQWAPVGIVTALMQTSPILLLPVERFVWRRRVTPGAVIGTLLAIGGAALLFIAP